MKVEIIKNYNKDMPNEFAAATTHGRKVKAPNEYWFRCEHSPIRLFRYFIKLNALKSFISTHLVRHGVFANHAVTSKRDDLRPNPEEVIGRNTPVTHIIETNAAELIFISRRRLCYKSHKETVGAWKHVTKEIKRHEPTLFPYLVPECVYRNGICPERTECTPGLDNVMKAYKDYPLLPKNKKSPISNKEKAAAANFVDSLEENY